MKNKLDFLMSLTETRNSVLSKATSFDPSYISRIRSGSRSMLKSRQFIETIASYFSRNLRTEEQRVRLAQELCPGENLPEDRETVEELLIAWLSREDTILEDPVSQFLSRFSLFSEKAYAAGGDDSGTSVLPEAFLQSILEKDTSTDHLYTYGNAGKRQAVEFFLARLCATGKRYMLLLFSDEDMAWLYEDDAFARHWGALLMHLLTTGSRIRIPHDITRDSNEMFEAAEKWLPLYLTGAIEPYYYPRLRDRVYRRSLFIAKGDSALISTSVGDHTEGMLNILIRDTKAVEALEREYQDYIRRCRPLFTISSTTETEECWRLFRNIDNAPGDLFIAHCLPSLSTMPAEIAAHVQEEYGLAGLTEAHAISSEAFVDHLRNGNHITEILRLPPPSKVTQEGIMIPAGEIFSTGSSGASRGEAREAGKASPKEPEALNPRSAIPRITARDLRIHLEKVIWYLRSEPNYHVFLTDSIPDKMLLYLRVDFGALVLSAMPRSSVFYVTESAMTSALRDYLVRIIEYSGEMPRKRTIRQLEEYIAKLRVGGDISL